MAVSDQLNGVAGRFPNVIVLVPWGEPNPAPVTVTIVPIGPELGDKDVMLGIPFPESGTVCGLLVASSTIVSIPDRGPTADGVNVIFTVQLVPDAMPVKQ